MPPSSPCDAWNELLYGANRGEIYQYFLNHKAELVDHLRNCENCHLQASLLAENTFDIIYSFDLMDADEFAKEIREMYKQAREKMSD